jgi:hypothetical protein
VSIRAQFAGFCEGVDCPLPLASVGSISLMKARRRVTNARLTRRIRRSGALPLQALI